MTIVCIFLNLVFGITVDLVIPGWPETRHYQENLCIKRKPSMVEVISNHEGTGKVGICDAVSPRSTKHLSVNDGYLSVYQLT